MYQFSRAIYRELASHIVEEKFTTQRDESNHLRVLRACEDSVQRLMVDRRYFARPARTLFNDIRMYFTMADQEFAFEVVARNLALADRYFAELPDYVYSENGTPRVCQAMTRKSTSCARQPLTGNDYCPSHQHLNETLEELEEVLPLAA